MTIAQHSATASARKNGESVIIGRHTGTLDIYSLEEVFFPSALSLNERDSTDNGHYPHRQ